MDDTLVDSANEDDDVSITPTLPQFMSSEKDEKVPEVKLPEKAVKVNLPQEKEIRKTTVELPNIQIEMTTVETGKAVSIEALLDSGATHCYIDKNFVQQNNLNTHKLHKAIPVYNVNNTRNEAGDITDVIDMKVRIDDHTERVTFAVTLL